MSNRLVTELAGGLFGPDAFPDAFHVTAGIIEDSLMQAGATPGKDYTILDLYRLAQPFVLHRYQAGELTDVGFDPKKH